MKVTLMTKCLAKDHTKFLADITIDVELPCLPAKGTMIADSDGGIHKVDKIFMDTTSNQIDVWMATDHHPRPEREMVAEGWTVL